MCLNKCSAQLGTLEISLWYDPVRSALHCTLHRGKGLRATDINGLADPFCKLNILPTNATSFRLKTKTVHKTINPEFNETVNFYGITEMDIQKKTLHILVLGMIMNMIIFCTFFLFLIIIIIIICLFF